MTRNNDARRVFKSNEAFALGFLLIGVGIGLLAGLFLAPRSGEEMREDIRRRSHEGLDYLNQQAEKVRESAGAALSKGKEWIGRKAEAVQSAAETKRPFHESI